MDWTSTVAVAVEVVAKVNCIIVVDRLQRREVAIYWVRPSVDRSNVASAAAAAAAVVVVVVVVRLMMEPSEAVSLTFMNTTLSDTLR